MHIFTPKKAQHSGADVKLIANDKCWIEGNALEQLEITARLEGIKLAVGYPDIHKGKGFPIGASFISQKIFYPALAGGDIGCGVGLWQTDLSARKTKLDKWERKLDNIDVPWQGDRSAWLTQYDIVDANPDSSLGTIGGGNHFAELQRIDEIIDPAEAEKLGLDKNYCQLLVHSGSRGLGHAILQHHLAKFGACGLTEGTPEVEDYFSAHDHALKWAVANRGLIAHRFASKLGTDITAVSDTSHNLISRENWSGNLSYVHRKGASEVGNGAVVLPGSRGAFSFLVLPTGNQEQSGMAIAHGAGRRWQRGKAKSRLSHKYKVQDLERTDLGSRVICENRELLYDEAPQAYKDITPVVDSLVEGGLIKVIARLRPLITYKCRRRG